MKQLTISIFVLFSSAAFAGDGIHGFSADGSNPHGKSGCASKNGKIAKFHKFENGKGTHKTLKQEQSGGNHPEMEASKKTPSLKDFI